MLNTSLYLTRHCARFFGSVPTQARLVEFYKRHNFMPDGLLDTDHDELTLQKKIKHLLRRMKYYANDCEIQFYEEFKDLE